MDLAAFLEYAQEWSDLGNAIQEQARSVAYESGDIEDQNFNALAHFAKLLDKIARDHRDHCPVCDSGRDCMGQQAKDLLEEFEKHGILPGRVVEVREVH